MTKTDELRRMLDDRGVEWCDSSDENVLHTTWNDMNCWFNEFPDGWTAWGMARRGTPEQAIAATLGNGTCENISDPPEGFYCSSCGWGDFAEPSHLLTTAKFTDNECGPNYCPNCGRAVKR